MNLNVVLTSHGSTGDIFPMIAFGVALREAGHRVRFATSPPFQREIEAAGLEFAGLPPPWTQRELAYWMGRLQKITIPLFQLRELYRAALPHITDMIDAMDAHLVDADVLVSSYLFPMTRALADRRGVPFATFAFAHNTVPSRYYPPEGLPRLRWMPQPVQHTWNRWLWRLGNVAVDTVINQTIARQLRARGLPLVKDFFSKPAKLVLIGVSPGLMKPPFRLHPRFQFVGYSRWQSSRDEQAGRDIVAFTGGARVPVLTFGSMVYDQPGEWIARLLRAWPREQKLIIQRGWADFRAPSEARHVLSVSAMSHDQLFEHASVVIHHGGAGTTASVLHAGKPHIIVPHIADQNFFALEIRRLGCGIRLGKKSWPEKLGRAVARVVCDDAMLARAARAREIVVRENGPQLAVAALERFVAAHARRAVFVGS